MESFLALLGVSIALFVSTNVDDIFVLVAFFADAKFRTRAIVGGQYAGISILVGVSLIASLLSLVIPRAYIGLLGLGPIAIGTKRIHDLYHESHRSNETVEQHADVGAYGQTVTVALVTIANGGDNIAVYAPSFAVRSRYEIAVVVLVFVLMTGLWCFAAHWTVHHPKLGAPIRRYGHRAAPVVLIVLGVLILYEAGTFRLPFH